MIREPLSDRKCNSEEKYVPTGHEKNSDGTYTVTFENGFAGVFSPDEYLKYDLFASGEENRLSYAELIYDVNFCRCRAMSLSLFKASPKPAAVVRMKMVSKGFSETVVDDALQALAGEGEIDDRLFAEKYARDRAEKGKSSGNLVARELEMKGVDPKIAEEAVKRFFTDDRAVAQKIAEKKAANGDGYEKIARYLIGKGFRQGLVRDILDEIFMTSGL